MTTAAEELEITTAVEELNPSIADDDDAAAADVPSKELEDTTDGEEIFAAQTGSASQESA